jgi:hypothetical protein
MNQNTGQKGGSADGAGTESSSAQTPQSTGLQTAIVGGAVAGANAGAIAAAEGYSSLKGSPLVGGRRRSKRGRSHGRGRQNQNPQSGGMVPGLMTAVETALVPLGLYLGQKTLQSRKSGSRSLGTSFNFRRSSRRSRRR